MSECKGCEQVQLGMSRFKQMQRANVDACWHKGHK